MKQPVDHILRPSLPWRTDPPMTECGYDASTVTTLTQTGILDGIDHNFGMPNVEFVLPSSGCIFCDLGATPELFQGVPSHIQRDHNVIVCTRSGHFTKPN